MVNIYDILINWNDIDKLYDFYEWESNDEFTHIKKIPLIKIKEQDYNNILNSDIKVNKEFLNLIKNKTEIYNKEQPNLYSTLFTDGIRAFAIKFNGSGRSIYKSNLLLDEKEEIIEISYKLKTSNIDYKIIKKISQNLYETRFEYQIRVFIEKELDKMYKRKEIDKLQYLYIEYFNTQKDNIDVIYSDLKDSLKSEINYKHTKLYELLKLSHTKKPVK